MRYYFELIKKYKFEITVIVVVIALSCVAILITKDMDEDLDLANYFWMPSSIMQSVAAIYALFIAIFVLSIQNNQRIISLLGDMLKPPFKVVSAIVAITIYSNGFVLFIFSHYKPIELEVNILYYSSLFSLLVSLIAIVYFSFWMISTVAGLNTHDEILYNLSQHKNIEECYRSLWTYVDIDADYSIRVANWNLKLDGEKNKVIEYCNLLLKVGTSDMKIVLAKFIGDIGDTRVGEQLIINLNDCDERVRSSSASALGIKGYTRAVEPLIKKLDDKSVFVRRSAVQSLGRIGDEIAVEPLIKKLEDQSEDVITSSELALGNIGDVRAVEPLIEKLDDKRDRVREFAVDALGMIGDPRAIEPITKRLDDNYFPVRTRSKTALEKIQERNAK